MIDRDPVAPFESRNQRDRRALEQQEQRFEIERLRERVRQERAKRDQIGSNASNSNRLAARVADLEASMLELAKGASKPAEVTATELTAMESENAKLSAQVSRLEAELAKLQDWYGTIQNKKASKPTVIDMPPATTRVAQ